MGTSVGNNQTSMAVTGVFVILSCFYFPLRYPDSSVNRSSKRQGEDDQIDRRGQRSDEGSKESALGCLLSVRLGFREGEQGNDGCEQNRVRRDTRTKGGRHRVGTCCLLVEEDVCGGISLFSNRSGVARSSRSCH